MRPSVPSKSQDSNNRFLKVLLIYFKSEVKAEFIYLDDPMAEIIVLEFPFVHFVVTDEQISTYTKST